MLKEQSKNDIIMVPLHILIISQALKKLLETGADPNKKSRDGMTPLAVAAFWGYDQIASLLIEKGWDIFI